MVYYQQLSTRDWSRIVVFFLLYFVTAKIGLTFDAVSGFATLVWIPSGLSLAALLLYGPILSIGIFLGAFLINFVSGASLFAAFGIAVGNTLEAIVAWYLLTHVSHVHHQFNRLKDAAGLIVFAAFFSTIVSATIGAFSLFLSGVIANTAFTNTWLAWWIGDMLSILVLTPFFLVWFNKFETELRFKTIVEAIAFTLFFLIYGYIIFQGFLSIATKNTPTTFVLFPPLILASLRYGQRGATAGVLLFAILAIISTVQGTGPFAEETLSKSLLFLQGFMGVIAITSLVLAAIDTERRELERKKDEFISIASHELKTPLTSIKAFNQLLERRLKVVSDQKSRLYLSRINKQVDKLARLVGELLDVTKINKGQLIFEKELFSLSKLIYETSRDIKEAHPSRIVELYAVKPSMIFADRDRIGQVLTNLVLNAFKYSPPEKKVKLRLISNKNMHLVSVQDFGKGISKDEQEKVFHQFYQGRPQGKEGQGLGLGLYIARTIVVRHGGSIWVKSILGRGSTFYFTLPKAPSHLPS